MSQEHSTTHTSEPPSPTDVRIPMVCEVCKNSRWYGPAEVRMAYVDGTNDKWSHYYECTKCNHMVSFPGRANGFEGSR